MKIVTVATPGALKDETSSALLEFWPGEHHLHLIQPGDLMGYGRILRDYWEAGDDFMVIEPDIVIRKDVADAFINCPCVYGCFPYNWLTDCGAALGCTWFRKEILQAVPDAMARVQAQNVTWRQVDVILMRHVLAREHGHQPHIHLPPVKHLNPNKELLPEANPEPLTYVPHW